MFDTSQKRTEEVIINLILNSGGVTLTPPEFLIVNLCNKIL